MRRRRKRPITAVTSTSGVAGFRHMHRVVIKFAVSAVEHVGDISLFEPFAKLRTFSIAECMIQDDGRRNLGLLWQ